MIKVLVFSATWCNHCGGVVKALKSTSLNVDYIDADSQPELTDKYNILNIPTILITENDKELDRFIGDEVLISTIEKLVKKYETNNNSTEGMPA